MSQDANVKGLNERGVHRVRCSLVKTSDSWPYLFYCMSPACSSAKVLGKFLRASPGAASPLSFIVLSMLVWEISLKGFLGQDSAVFDDFGDPSGAFEDLGGSVQHSK